MKDANISNIEDILLYTNGYLLFLENNNDYEIVNNLTVSYYIFSNNQEQIYYLVGTNSKRMIDFFANQQILEQFITANPFIVVENIIYKTSKKQTINLVFLDPV